MSGQTDKYVREVQRILHEVNNALLAAMEDTSLSDAARQEVEWELARLKGSVAEAAASLVAVAARDEGL